MLIFSVIWTHPSRGLASNARQSNTSRGRWIGRWQGARGGDAGQQFPALRRAVGNGVGSDVLPVYLNNPGSGVMQLITHVVIPTIDCDLAYPEAMNNAAQSVGSVISSWRTHNSGNIVQRPNQAYSYQLHLH